MADYNTIQAILSSTENIVQLRTNSKDDDGTTTVAGVDWFTFNNAVCSSIYYSGNMWMSFGASSEHLKINRRDGAVWNFWREEGTLYGQYKFLRLKWGGYAHYSSTSQSDLIVYEVILFETGDIFLNIITWPTNTSYLSGVNQLIAGSTYSFAPTQESKQFSFYSLDDTGRTFRMEADLIDIPIPGDYLWQPWVQPTITTNDSYGIVSASSVDSESWRVGDGVVATSWESAKDVVSAWWTWKLPVTLKITKVTITTNITKKMRVFADCDMSIALGDELTFEQTGFSKKEIILSEPVITDTLKVNCFESYGDRVDIAEIEVEAEQGSFVKKENRFLVESGGIYYKIENRTKTVVEMETLDATTLINHGSTQKPDSDTLLMLMNPQILCWNIDPATCLCSVTETAMPHSQIIETDNYDMTHETIKGIQSAIAVCSDDVQFQLSFDSGVVWKVFTEAAWSTQDVNGAWMSKSDIVLPTAENWAEVATTGTYKVRFKLLAESSYFTNLYFKYIN